jgi:hypothetical protein
MDAWDAWAQLFDATVGWLVREFLDILGLSG